MRLPSYNAITLGFGSTNAPYSASNPHKGVDFAPDPDPVIYCPEDGQISLVLNDPSMGDSIHLWTENRHHAFCHTSKRFVSPGEQVKAGDRLGVMGHTGYVVPSGPAGTHLHWALAVDGQLVNPLSFVTGGKGAAENMEPFNKGDAINWSNAYYGVSDPPQFVLDQIGKDWKTAMYNLMGANNLGFAVRANSGDNVNIKTALGVDMSIGGSLTGLTWKQIWYQFVVNHLPKNKSGVQPATPRQIAAEQMLDAIERAQQTK
jgi:hypothetical protein